MNQPTNRSIQPESSRGGEDYKSLAVSFVVRPTCKNILEEVPGDPVVGVNPPFWCSVKLLERAFLEAEIVCKAHNRIPW